MAMIPAALQLLSFLSLLAVHTSVANDQLIFVYHECNNNLGNFTPGSNHYSTNRDSLLQLIYSDKEIGYGFYNLSYGQDPNGKVNGIGLCRGDVKPDECRNCLQNSAVLLTDRCTVQKEAVGWYDKCMLRYSNRSIFGVLETVPDNVWCSPRNITTSGDVFKKVVNELLDGLRNATASGDSRLKVAEANATVGNSTIYALLQCTPDLSEQNCTRCLNQSFSRISQYCDGKQGARFVGPSCSTRYESNQFFGPILDLDTTAPAPAPRPAEPLSPPSSSPFSL